MMIWVKTNQYVNIDGEKYEPGTYHLKCLHKKIQLDLLGDYYGNRFKNRFT